MIKTKLLAAGAALAAALLLGACGSSGDGTGPTSSPSASGAPGTLSSAAPAKGAHNDADVAFASMMIPHHDQAIEMSDILLAKSGIDPKVTALAHQIKIAQGPEVAQMGGWLAGWGSKPGPSMGGMGGMGDGMMSQADMDGLKDADGHQAARLFLTGMIKHHQGAVIMAQSELASGQNPDAKKLAHSIVTAQRAEITEMNQLLGR